MSLFNEQERRIAIAVAALTDCSPFVAQRVEIERTILDDDFIPIGNVWWAESDQGVFDPNLPNLRDRVERLAATARDRLLTAGRAAPGAPADFSRIHPEEYTAYKGLISTRAAFLF